MLVLALLALRLLWRTERRLAGMTALAFLVQLFLHAKWDIWWGGGTWGPRLMMPVAPLLCLALAPMLGGRAHERVAVVSVGIVSMGVNLAGLLHEYTPFLDRNGLTGYEDVLSQQIHALSPGDLNGFVAVRSLSGTFWPELTTFGVVLLATSIAVGFGLMRALAILRRWHVVAAGVAALVFVGARERTIPYRILARAPGPPVTTTELDLASAELTNVGQRKPASSPLMLRGPSSADLRTYLRPGRYAIAMELALEERDASFQYALRLGADEVASGTIAPPGPASITSRPVRVYRRGWYTLHVDASPLGGGIGNRRAFFRRILWCQKLALLTLP
ncbi:MAG: hypothetical protein U0166_28990 [Acidobacteriota bacterium]